MPPQQQRQWNNTAFKSVSTLIGKGIHHASKVAIRNPIEIIVATLLLASFGYFTLYNLARSSEIFSGTSYTRLYPTTVYSINPHKNGFMPIINNKQQEQEGGNNDNVELTSLTSIPKNALKLYLKQITVSDTERGVQNVNTLATILQFQQTIENTVYVPEGNENSKKFSYQNGLCYRKNDKQCFVQSPLTLWGNDIDRLKQDKDIPLTLMQANNHSNTMDTSSSTVTLAYVVNATGSMRHTLATQWAHKVENLPPTKDIVSHAHRNEGENVLAWLFIIGRNVVLRLKELIDVSNKNV